MRVMSRAFRLHQNIEPIVVVDLRSLHLITSSLRLVNNTSSRKRLATLSYQKLYTQCFTSCHHVISNKIHDFETSCASRHERFDCIKTFTRHVVDLRSLDLNPSSLRLASHRCRHASVMQLTASSQNFTRISIVDRFDFFKSLKS